MSGDHPVGARAGRDGADGGAGGAKAALRSRVRAARRALVAAGRAALDADLAVAGLAAGGPLAAAARGSAVALYASRPTEPGTRGLREALASRGVVVLLPVVVGPEAPLAWEVDGGGGGAGGWPGGRVGGWPGGPVGGPDGVGVVLLPALAVDRSGVRLGQGGGHYDRTLAALRSALPPGSAVQDLPDAALPAGSAVRRPPGGALPAGSAVGWGAPGAGPLLVAVVRDEELLPAGALPREPHDVLVHAALTPSGWHDLRR